MSTRLGGVLENAKEVIFGLFTVSSEGDGIYLESRTFLGTAFFVSDQGDALTAGHVLPSPEQLGDKRRIIAVRVCEGRQQIHFVTQAAVFAAWDLGLLRVDLEKSRPLPVASTDIFAGTDVVIIGIPDHEIWGEGKELRLLKGHCTLTIPPWAELSCHIPPGMSGSPLFVGGQVVGCVVGTFRSDQIEDSTEERREVRGEKEIVQTTTIHRVFYYGKALLFAHATGRQPLIGNKNLLTFLAERNRG
jgi:hypothetical protein